MGQKLKPLRLPNPDPPMLRPRLTNPRKAACLVDVRCQLDQRPRLGDRMTSPPKWKISLRTHQPRLMNPRKAACLVLSPPTQVRSIHLPRISHQMPKSLPPKNPRNQGYSVP